MSKKAKAKTDSVAKLVKRKDHVLLVNPPVEDTRYSWIKWNQPLDLLKIASFLRTEIGCEVTLLDFMKPDREGEVVRQRLPIGRENHEVGGEIYPMRRFGQPYDRFFDWVRRNEAEKPGSHAPTQIWITSLCS